MTEQKYRGLAHSEATNWCLFCVLCGLTLLVFGCASGTTKKASSLKSAKNVESSAQELSSRNHSLLAVFSSEIETAADRIILQSPSAGARRQALEWKAEAIPILQTSLLNDDPVSAILDAWTFVLQMMSYMEQPAVKQGFAGSYPIVDAALKRMDAEMQQLVQVAAPTAKVAVIRQSLASWAQAHPLQNSVAGRPSFDAEWIRKRGESDLGTMASIKALGESLGDLTARLDAYNAYLPKQARWQAELLLSDVARRPEFGAAMANAKTLSDALAKTSNTMEHMPELVAQTRAGVMADVESQRLAAQAFVREERIQAFNALRQERIAIAANISRERQAATAGIRAESQKVLGVLHDERMAAESDLRAAGEKTLQDFDDRARVLTNRFFLMALGFMLLTLVLCSLVAWLLLRRFAEARPVSGQTLHDRAA
jgi:hypothetical protein